jgi:hypothetical protein
MNICPLNYNCGLVCYTSVPPSFFSVLQAGVPAITLVLRLVFVRIRSRGRKWALLGWMVRRNSMFHEDLNGF